MVREFYVWNRKDEALAEGFLFQTTFSHREGYSAITTRTSTSIFYSTTATK